MNKPLASLFAKHKAIVLFDCETTGTDPAKNQIIELASMRIEQTNNGSLRVAGQMDNFIRLPEGERIPEKIVELTGITDEILQAEGVATYKVAAQFAKLLNDGPVLMVAHNAQFDLLFTRELLRGHKCAKLSFLDTMTVYKDRRPYPHKLANAIISYNLTDKVQNSHRAIDDVLALFEILKEMGAERDDLATYVNLFGYNAKYGVNGSRIAGVRYEAQDFNKIMTRPEQTLPARVARGGAAR